MHQTCNKCGICDSTLEPSNPEASNERLYMYTLARGYVRPINIQFWNNAVQEALHSVYAYVYF